jgi:hypothetical protein
MTLGTVLLIILILLLVGAIPSWPHSRGWGYGPSGILGVILLIVIVLFVLGRL